MFGDRFFTRSLFISLMMTGFLASAHAAEPCQPMVDALTKLVTTPIHSYATDTPQFVNHRRLRSSETIHLKGKVYVRANGKGMNSPVTPAEVLALEKENREHGKANCQFVRNESVNGEAAMVYTMHSDMEDSKDDAQMLISRATGLPLREEMAVDVGGAAGKDHFSAL